MTRVLGIDPGINGAYALIAGDTVIVDDLPIANKALDAGEFSRIIKALRVDHAVVELVHAMPKNSPNSMFNFGRVVGAIHATIACSGVPMSLVTPQTWKKRWNLGADKERARETAIRLFPAVTGLSRKCDVDRAEALLIATHWLETKRATTF